MVLCTVVPAQAPKPVPLPPTLGELQGKIDGAIHRGVDALLRQQQADGTWKDHEYSYPVGPTALCAYTLIKSGLATDHPAVARAFRFLEKNLSNKTYGIACQLMAFEAAKDKRYRPQMKELLHRLLEGQRGGWGYPGGHVDLSNTQYGALGLRAARMAGLKVPRRALLKLIDAALQHQEKPGTAEIPPDPVKQRDGYGRVSGPGKVAGFTYRIHKTGQNRPKATGSMTTAGLGVLLICEELLEGKLARTMRRKFDASTEQGLNWMRVNWSVARNPHGGWHLYYLYGLERVGALLKREVMAGRFWYREGAAHLVKSQNAQGRWGGIPDTCFGLLFLKRATSLGAVTGAGGTDRTQRVYLASNDAAEVELRGAGNPKLSIWIAGFNQKKLEKRFPKQKGKRDVRVASVEYLVDGNVVHKQQQAERKTWNGEPFGFQYVFKQCGRYNVAAKVHVENPDAALDGEAKTIILESPVLVVEVLDLPDPERDALGASLQENKLRKTQKHRVRVSSASHGWWPWICDGRFATAWLCKDTDAKPWIKIKPRNGFAVRQIILWPNQSDAGIKEVEVVLNGQGRPRKVEFTNPRKPAQISFRRRKPIEELQITITKTDKKPGEKRKVGFAEIILR